MENLNPFDIVIVVLVVLLGLKGLFRGFTRELFGLVGIIGGVFVASRLANNIGAFVNTIVPMDNENTILLSGFILTLVVFWTITYLIGMTVSKVLSVSGLGIFDRLLGFIFGASKIFLLFSIISYAITQVKIINDNLAPKLENSIVFPILTQAGKYIIKLDAGNIQKKASEQLDHAIETTKETITEITNAEIKKKVKEVTTEMQDNISGNK